MPDKIMYSFFAVLIDINFQLGIPAVFCDLYILNYFSEWMIYLLWIDFGSLVVWVNVFL